MNPLANFARFIRFSHTVFALPFAFIGMISAAEGLPEAEIFIGITLCMVSARTLAMLFNRLADWKIDKLNPRTKERHTLVSPPVAFVAMIFSAAIFVAGAAWLNPLCLALSPAAIALVCFYSLTKRFTALCHFFLGLALSASPVGAWIAVTGEMSSLQPYLIAAGVLFWVAGFDLIYATMDESFDRRHGLFSIPAIYGKDRTLLVAGACHLAAFTCFIAFGIASGFGTAYFSVIAVVLAAMIYEQFAGRAKDEASVQNAFFRVNAFIGFLMLSGVCWEILWLK